MEQYMLKIVKKYDSLKSALSPNEECPFWDVVVITTVDESQKLAYNLQLRAKLERNEIPQFCDYVIVSDPPGVKIGNGGATFVALSELYLKYGENLFDMKVFLLHSGGHSVRLPSASVCGKVFTVLPTGSPLFHMLDLQLAMYLPFIGRMNPGVFLTSSDVLVMFDLEGYESDIRFVRDGFTAFAHLSPPHVGIGHGVYVVEKDSPRLGDKVQLLDCLRVLQKPQLKEIFDSGAVFESRGREVVYTDSSFHFDHSVTRVLLDFYRNNAPIVCEVDAYGDFLQALGRDTKGTYLDNTVNIASASQYLIEIRTRLYDLLRRTPTKILALNESQFMHIGTLREYLFHFCENQAINHALAFSRITLSKCESSDSLDGCVIRSRVACGSVCPRTSIVEYCSFDKPIRVGNNSVISNCQFLREEFETLSRLSGRNSLDEILDIPSDTFMHTVPVRCGFKTRFITMFFDIADDVKRMSKGADENGSLPFVSSVLHEYARLIGIPLGAFFGESSERINLWHCKLFPAFETMTESFYTSLLIICGIRAGETNFVKLENNFMMSSADILKCKDISAMLSYRNDLNNIINS